MVRVVCPSCGVGLNAKDELLGQSRPCPQCGKPVLIRHAIEPAGGGSPLGTGQRLGAPKPAGGKLAGVDDSELPVEQLLSRLDRSSHYFVLSHSSILATWEDNGRGWLLKTPTGVMAARRADSQLPPEGDFRLVELQAQQEAEGTKITGIRVFELARRWSLIALARGDDPIVEKIVGRVGLSQQQKMLVRTAIRDRFMPEVWEGATAVHTFLSGNDFTATGTDSGSGAG